MCTVYVDGIDEYYLVINFSTNYNQPEFEILCAQYDDEENIVHVFAEVQSGITAPQNIKVMDHIKSLMVEGLRKILRNINFLNIRNRNNIVKIIDGIIWES
jgi:hypothetical protein